MPITHTGRQRGKRMSELEKTAILVDMYERRYLRHEWVTAETSSAVQECLTDGLIIDDGSGDGYVMTILGTERLWNFRALFDMDRDGRPITE